MIIEKKYNTREVPIDKVFYTLNDYHRTIITNIMKESYKFHNPIIVVGMEIMLILESNPAFSSIFPNKRSNYIGKLMNHDIYLDYNIDLESVIIGDSLMEIKKYITIKNRKEKLNILNKNIKN
jgi:hypothetical protein